MAQPPYGNRCNPLQTRDAPGSGQYSFNQNHLRGAQQQNQGGMHELDASTRFQPIPGIEQSAAIANASAFSNGSSLPPQLPSQSRTHHDLGGNGGSAYLNPYGLQLQQPLPLSHNHYDTTTAGTHGHNISSKFSGWTDGTRNYGAYNTNPSMQGGFYPHPAPTMTPSSGGNGFPVEASPVNQTQGSPQAQYGGSQTISTPHGNSRTVRRGHPSIRSSSSSPEDFGVDTFNPNGVSHFHEGLYGLDLGNRAARSSGASRSVTSSPSEADVASSDINHTVADTGSATGIPSHQLNNRVATFSATITTPSDAHDQLFKPDTQYYQLEIKDDDVKGVEGRKLEYAKRIFDGILDKPDTPKDLSDEEKAEFEKKLSEHLKQCENRMITDQDTKDASARCMLMVDTVVKLHKKGIPMNRLRSSRKKLDSVMDANDAGTTTEKSVWTRTNFHVDTSTKCSKRLEHIATIVKEDKLAANDLLKYIDKITAFAYAPDRYETRKKSNLKGNKSKGDLLKRGNPAKKQKEAQPAGVMSEDGAFEGDDVEEPQPVKTKKATRKRKSALAMEDDGAPPARNTRAKRARRNMEG